MHSLRRVPLLVLVLVAVSWLSACDDSVVVVVQSGPQRFALDFDSSPFPSALRDESDGQPRVATVPCGPANMCPSTEALPVTCEVSVCDPAPQTLSLPLGDVVDIDALAADARGLLRHVDAIEILEARYEIAVNTLSVDTPAIEIFWGPETATEVDPAMGVVTLGWLAPIPAGSDAAGTVALDADGVSALSDYLVDTSRRVRLFARTSVDLSPGDAIAEGTLHASVDMRVRITGSLLR